MDQVSKLRQLHIKVKNLESQLIAVEKSVITLPEILRITNKILKLKGKRPIPLNKNELVLTKSEALNKLAFIIWHLVDDTSPDRLPD